MPVRLPSVHTTALLAVLAMAAAPAGAQRARADSAAADSARRLAPVVTTATRAPARADELPQRVTTITRADLERTPVVDAVDALKKLAGVDVIQYPSLLGFVSVRGFRPSSSSQTRTLVLIDGRPAGAYNLALVDVTAIERIEVLRGPASALYGSSAMGGVVNLITRRTTGRLAGTVAAAYGSFATSELTARGGGVIARPAGYALDADVTARRYEQGSNYRVGRGGTFRSALGGERATKVYSGTTRPSREVGDTAGDGLLRDFTTLASVSGSARVGMALPGAFRVDVRGERFEADDVLSPGDIYARLSNSPGNARKNVARRTEDATLRRDPAPDALTRGISHAPLVRVYSAREESENFDQPGDAGFVSFAGATRTAGFQLQDVVRLGGQSLTTGVDASRVDDRSRRFARRGDAIQEIGTFSPNARYASAAAFAQAQLRSPGGRVTGVLGGRLDRVTLELRETPFRPEVTAGTDRFTVFNPNVGLQVGLGGGLRAHATAGRAFLNPSASGLAGFSQSVTNNVAAITVGNPTLRPEHSVTVDGGLALSLPRHGLALDVTYFATAVEDRISTARALFAAGRRPTTAAGQQISGITTSANAGEARIRGLEADARYDLGRAMGRAYSLALTANATRIFRAEERTLAVVVDTAGLSAARSLDARVVFDRITLDPSRATTLRIRNVADLTTTAGIDYDDFRRFTGRLGARYVGRRLDSDFSDASDPGDIEYAPFVVMDLTAGVRVGGRYRVEGQVSNLTDENYYEKRGYNLPGRAVRLRLSTDF
jgi:vitamin B12 transporter